MIPSCNYVRGLLGRKRPIAAVSYLWVHFVLEKSVEKGFWRALRSALIGQLISVDGVGKRWVMMRDDAPE